MIIVSQDKSVIVNFDNITLISKNDDESKIFCEVNTRSTIMIGEYKTEERAKEVLEQIYLNYSDFELIKNICSEDYQRILISRK